MPKPSIYEQKWNGKSGYERYDAHKSDWCKISYEQVKENILSVSKNLENIMLIKGLVENTLLIENNLPKKISLLRLDTDFYESTKIELEILYPRLSKGGVLIIDDYGNWKGSKKAVDDFFNKKALLIYLDHGVRMCIKQ